MSLWRESRIKQRKAGEALRHECRMALPNAANLNLDRIPIGTGVKSSAAVLFGPVLASGRGSRIIGHSLKETRFQAIGGLSQSSLPLLRHPNWSPLRHFARADCPSSAVAVNASLFG